ncbi:MAG: ATP-grasp domain-containing protein [Proteobacteria bacterium]|nr:ATP-grasp domain-containing protein [Pseudomonadota bacterium]
MQDKRLLIIGASARAACFSASRAGFEPYWIDQFGDCDLSNAFDGNRVASEDYPAGIINCVQESPDAPWLYTGAMENHLNVLEQVAQMRPLLGNDRAVCVQVRDPVRLAACVSRAGIASPEIFTHADVQAAQQRCLIKPVHGAGGMGISVFNDAQQIPAHHYLQEFIEGQSVSAVFIGNAAKACLLGVTRQLIGEPDFNAAAFNYCGSIGPLALSSTATHQWSTLGNALVKEFGLRGLFGVDAIMQQDVIFPVEVNPRYTASVEVIELATGLPVIAMHCQACAGLLPVIEDKPVQKLIGKAYLFAPHDLQITDIPASLNADVGDGLPCIADIPETGAIIYQGKPVMTLLVEAADEEKCRVMLKHAVSQLMQTGWLVCCSRLSS